MKYIKNTVQIELHRTTSKDSLSCMYISLINKKKFREPHEISDVLRREGPKICCPGIDKDERSRRSEDKRTKPEDDRTRGQDQRV
jgi:hypothetical protein